MTYHLNDNGTHATYTDHDEFEDAVRDALEEWTNGTYCPVFDGSDHICCMNHPEGRFSPCNVCVATERAAEDDQAWLVGEIAMPYEIRLPGTGATDARHIRAWED